LQDLRQERESRVFEASLGGARHRQKGWKIVQRGAHVKLEPWLDQD
jgi:hypothetical protein